MLSEKARLHLEKYSFPVEMMVALPNGTIVNILLLSAYNSQNIQDSVINRSCVEALLLISVLSHDVIFIDVHNPAFKRRNDFRVDGHVASPPPVCVFRFTTSMPTSSWTRPP